MESQFLEEARALLGAEGVISDAAARSPYETDWRGLVRNPAVCVLLPRTTAEVAAAMRLCARHGRRVTPQGGNTGLVAGAVPSDASGQVVLALRRMNRIRAVDAVNAVMVAEAGVVLAAAQAAARGHDMLLPLSLAAEGSCQIGGAVATNAGGVQALAYGSMRDLVLGLEVVLADGTVLNGLRALRKNNTGLDLRHLFVGSEGTLGVVTAAAIRLVPRPAVTATILLAAPSVAAVVAVFARFRAAFGPGLTSFEFFTAAGLALSLAHGSGGRSPFAAPAEGYVLAEIALPAGEDPAGRIGDLVEQALADGLVEDALLAQSERQRLDLWRLREDISEGERRAGGAIKHDIAVPISEIAATVATILARLRDERPEVAANVFGHIGDGNLHVNLMPAPGHDLAALKADEAALSAIVLDAAAAAGGTFSAEHGIGLLRRGVLLERLPPEEIAVMRRIKAALDPHGLLNPGKVLDPRLPAPGLSHEAPADMTIPQDIAR